MGDRNSYRSAFGIHPSGFPLTHNDGHGHVGGEEERHVRRQVFSPYGQRRPTPASGRPGRAVVDAHGDGDDEDGDEESLVDAAEAPLDALVADAAAIFNSEAGADGCGEVSATTAAAAEPAASVAGPATPVAVARGGGGRRRRRHQSNLKQRGAERDRVSCAWEIF